MNNAIVINGEIYELVANETGKDLCETCDLRERCDNIAGYVYLCVAVHGEENEHYKKHRGRKANELHTM